MKKIALFALIATLGLSSISCSSDDSSAPVNQVPVTGGTVTFKVDGVAKTFNTINVNVEPGEGQDADNNYLLVTASANNDPSEVMSFVVQEGQIGANAAYNWAYTAGGKNYYAMFNNVVQTNSTDKRLIGSFSGNAEYYNGMGVEVVAISEGVFNITY